MLAVTKQHSKIKMNMYEKLSRNCAACRGTRAATQQLYSVLWQRYVSLNYQGMKLNQMACVTFI